MILLVEALGWMWCEAWSKIQGAITIDSTLGKGTTFTIRLPLTLSICKALCCVSDKARIAFPMDGVEQMICTGKKCDYRSSWAILYFLAWFLAAIPTLEGTANTIANSVAATSMAAAARTI